jgi:uncharacterized DUF497 family protein
MATWDLDKRLLNLRKHGVDLALCGVVFDSPLVTHEDDRADYGEQRLQSLGMLDTDVVFMVWTERDTGPHLISVRKANRHEQEYYFANLRHLGF